MNYGFVPRTLAGDEDSLDVLVLCSEALDPLTEVDGYPIGVVKMIDDDRVDEKIIAIPFRDPTYSSFHDLSDLPQHTVSEVSHFFDVYKALEHSKRKPKAARRQSGSLPRPYDDTGMCLRTRSRLPSRTG
jgi:inorganic pyrophosphatase